MAHPCFRGSMYWSYSIGTMENTMETTIVYGGFIGRMENK